MKTVSRVRLNEIHIAGNVVPARSFSRERNSRLLATACRRRESTYTPVDRRQRQRQRRRRRRRGRPPGLFRLRSNFRGERRGYSSDTTAAHFREHEPRARAHTLENGPDGCSPVQIGPPSTWRRNGAAPPRHWDSSFSLANRSSCSGERNRSSAGRLGTEHSMLAGRGEGARRPGRPPAAAWVDSVGC